MEEKGIPAARTVRVTACGKSVHMFRDNIRAANKEVNHCV